MLLVNQTLHARNVQYRKLGSVSKIKTRDTLSTTSFVYKRNRHRKSSVRKFAGKVIATLGASSALVLASSSDTRLRSASISAAM